MAKHSSVTGDPIDDIILAAGWITQGGPRHVKHVFADGKRRRWALGLHLWHWQVVDESVPEVLASGRAWSRRRADRRCHKAYVRILRKCGAS